MLFLGSKHVIYHAIDTNNVLYFMDEWFQGPTEKDQIDVQGDISYDIVEFITETWRDVTYSNLCLQCYALI